MPHPYVFISYSHDDKDDAIAFSKRLKEQGIAHFRDDEMIAWGEDIPAKIHEAIERATHLVVLVSPGSEQSQWVAYEMGYARGRKIQLIPYLLHPSMKLPHFISSKRYILDSKDETKFRADLKRSQIASTQSGQDKKLTGDDKLGHAVRLLANPNAKVRAEGIAELVRLKARQQLLEALRHPKATVRASAAQGCAALKIREAIPYLIAGMYDAGAGHQPVIPGAEILLNRFGAETLRQVLDALDSRPLGWAEQRRWEAAIAQTLSKRTVPLVIKMSGRFPWILRPLLRSRVTVGIRTLIAALESAVHKPNGEIAASECLPVLQAIQASNLRSNADLGSAIKAWVYQYLEQGDPWWLKEIIVEAISIGAVSNSEINDAYYRNFNTLNLKVRNKLGEILRIPRF